VVASNMTRPRWVLIGQVRCAAAEGYWLKMARGAAGHLLGRNVLGLTSARLVRTLPAAVDCFRRPMRTGRAGRVPRVDQQSDGSEPAVIPRVAEAEIPADLALQVQALLQMCFPGYPSRAYFKLPPHFREWCHHVIAGMPGLAGVLCLSLGSGSLAGGIVGRVHRDGRRPQVKTGAARVAAPT
jgi:hypothetical protein